MVALDDDLAILDGTAYAAFLFQELAECHNVFLSADEFKARVANGEFLEYEEVYPGRFYGTLRSQVESQLAQGQNVILDIDVQGGCHVKEVFGPRALSLFIQPPSIDELRRRLEGRGTDSPDVIQSRIDKAAFELTFAPRFDRTIINDDLEVASSELLQVVEQFLSSES